MLAVMDEPEIKPLDPVLCISKEVREAIPIAMNVRTIPVRTYWKDGEFWTAKEDCLYSEGTTTTNEQAPSWWTSALKGATDDWKIIAADSTSK